MLADPERPPPQDVLRALSNGVEYVDSLKRLYGEAESAFVVTSEDVKSMVSIQTPKKEGCSEGTGMDSDEPVLISSENMNIVHSVVSQHSGSANTASRLLSEVGGDELDVLQVAEGLDTKVLEVICFLF